MRWTINLFFSSLLIGLMVGCGGNDQPKPKALLRLQYPEPLYNSIPDQYPFGFEYNRWAILKELHKRAPEFIIPR